MQDNEARETYRAMQLSHDLRPAILQRREARRRQALQRVRLLQAAAACVCVCVAVTVALLQNRTGVYTGGGRLGTDARDAAVQTVSYTGAARTAQETVAEDCLPLTVRYGETVSVTTDAGMLLLPDGAEQHCRFAGQSASVQNGTTVYWCVSGCATSAPLQATVCRADGTPIAVLTADFDGQWQLSVNEIHK